MSIVGQQRGKEPGDLCVTAFCVLRCPSLDFAPWRKPPTAMDGNGWWPRMYGPSSFNTDLERSLPPAGGISNDTNFDGVLDKFDGAFQVHVEGQEAHWGMLADFTYLGLSDDHDYPRFHTESDLDARLFDVAAVWSPGDDRYQRLGCLRRTALHRRQPDSRLHARESGVPDLVVQEWRNLQ